MDGWREIEKRGGRMEGNIEKERKEIGKQRRGEEKWRKTEKRRGRMEGNSTKGEVEKMKQAERKREI